MGDARPFYKYTLEEKIFQPQCTCSVESQKNPAGTKAGRRRIHPCLWCAGLVSFLISAGCLVYVCLTSTVYAAREECSGREYINTYRSLAWNRTGLGPNIRDHSCHVYYSEQRIHHQDTHLDPAGYARTLNNWATKGNRIHVGAGIHYDDTSGRFTVSVAGNYMIYSHMAFQPAPHILNRYQTKGHNLSFLFLHTVRAHGVEADDDITAMKDSAEVTCHLRHRYGGALFPCYRSNIIGMMPLNEGDDLSVEVAPLDFLLGEMKSSYFGFFLMG